MELERIITRNEINEPTQSDKQYESLTIVDTELEKLFGIEKIETEYLKSEDYPQKEVRGKFRAK